MVHFLKRPFEINSSGVSRASRQKRLLTEKELTFTKAVQLAPGMEAAEHSSKAIKGTALEVKLQKLTVARSLRNRIPCYRCGRSNHSANDCKFKGAEYHNWHKKAHIAPVCQTKKVQNLLDSQVLHLTNIIRKRQVGSLQIPMTRLSTPTISLSLS